MLKLAGIFIIATHVVAAWPMVRALRRRRMPSTIDFACASVIMYYDLGLVIELLGLHDDRYFPPFFSLPADTVSWALLFLLLAPWLFRLGDLIVSVGRPVAGDAGWSAIHPRRVSLFYVAMTALCIAVAMLGVRSLLAAPTIWQARSTIGLAFGPYIIVLYIPIFVLGFFVRQTQARTRAGIWFIAFLVVTGLAAAGPVGERSLLILPVLIPLAFRSAMTSRRVISLGVGAVLAASLLLPLLKWQFAEKDLHPGQLMLETIESDFSRSSVLATALELSRPAGTMVLRYPFEGYVYSALLFVPRRIVPWKGQSTPVYYTAAMTGISVEDTQWMFGIGAIESAALNGGLVAVAPMLLLCGIGLAVLDRVSAKVPGVVVPARLFGLWTCCYDISALLLVYGGMFLLGYLLHDVFVRSWGVARAPSPRPLPTRVAVRSLPDEA